MKHYQKTTTSASSKSPRGATHRRYRRTIWSGVMPDDIEVELAPHDIVQIQVGYQDALLLEQWPSEDLAKRADDHAAARDHDIRRHSVSRVTYRVVCGVVFLFGVLARGQHEASAFDSNVAHGVLPDGPCIYGGGAVDLCTLGVVERSHCGPEMSTLACDIWRECTNGGAYNSPCGTAISLVLWPDMQATDSPTNGRRYLCTNTFTLGRLCEMCLVHWKCRLVPLAPYDSLHGRGDQLSVLRHVPKQRVHEHDSAV